MFTQSTLKFSLAPLVLIALAALTACQSSENDAAGSTSRSATEIAPGIVAGEVITRYQPPALGSQFTAARNYDNSNKNITETVDQLDTQFNGVKAFRTATPELYTYYGYDGGPMLAITGKQGEVRQVNFARGAYIPFPVKPGDAWDYIWTKRLPAIDQSNGNAARMTAEKWEMVTLPSGDYKTLKINGKDEEGGSNWSIWYAPAIGKVVKYTGPFTALNLDHVAVSDFKTPQK